MRCIVMAVPSLGKYSVPVIPAGSLKRARLVSLIQSLSSRSVLFIHAPAGYGKTTAAVQWLMAKDIKAAWFSLDEYDVSAGDFYRGLLMAFVSCNAESGNAELIKNVINDKGFDAFPLQHTLELFARFNFDEGPFAVVIDDFHLFQDPYVSLSLPVLRSRLPVHVRFIVLSRNPPGDVLNGYILKEVLKQISLEELQFTNEEVSKLFSKHSVRLSDYDAVQIQNQTLGWPIALSALLLSRAENGKAGLVLDNRREDDAYLYSYIKSQIYEFWDKETRDILLKTSICEFVTPELCERLTKQQNSWGVLESLSLKTGLMMRYGADSCRYQKLLREFLTSELDADESIDKMELYRNAGLWHKENGNILAALDMAAKSGDISLIEDIARLHSYAYGRFNIGVESYVKEVYRHVLRKLPVEVIERSPRLCLECWFATHAMGDCDESKIWMSAVKKHVASGVVTLPQDMFMAFFQFAADPEKDSWFIINLLKQMDLKAEQLPSFSLPGQAPLPSFTLTYNMPLYHRAQRDYCEVSPALDEYIMELSEYLPQVLSPYHETLLLLIEGGVRFERHELVRAKEYARRACKAADGSPPELMFASLILLCEAYWAEGCEAETADLRTKIDELITKSNAFYLTANWNAYTTNLALYNGDTIAAGNWLLNYMLSDKDNLSLYKCFQSFTTAKALIVAGRLTEAVDYLKAICEFSTIYMRNVDLIEANALLAVCFWRMKSIDNAVDALTNALVTAQSYELPMPIAKHGADIVPILNKLMNRLRAGYDTEKLDKSFVGTIFFNAREFAGHYGGFFAKTTARPVKLSPKQTLILKYLSQNLSYREMGELMGTKITTIKDHVTKLYQKLGVNNVADALHKAKEQGLF